MPDRTCSIIQCPKPRHQRELCKGHYTRLWKYGDPLHHPFPSAMERFWAKVDRDQSGCWLWTAGLFEKGYGQFKVERKDWRAHRWAYSVMVEPIPEGMELDHLCNVRRCVNPCHLELVTHEENVRRRDERRSA